MEDKGGASGDYVIGGVASVDHFTKGGTSEDRLSQSGHSNSSGDQTSRDHIKPNGCQGNDITPINRGINILHGNHGSDITRGNHDLVNGNHSNNKIDDKGLNNDPQRIQVKIKTTPGKQHFLQTLGACLTSCDAVTTVDAIAGSDVTKGAYTLSGAIRSDKTYPSSPVLVTSGRKTPLGHAGSTTSSMTSITSAGHNDIKGMLTTPQKTSHHMSRPRSMVDLSPSKGAVQVWPELHVLSPAGSLDNGLQRATNLHSKSGLRRSHGLAPPTSHRPHPLMDRPQTLIVRDSPSSSRTHSPREYREAEGWSPREGGKGGGTSSDEGRGFNVGVGHRGTWGGVRRTGRQGLQETDMWRRSEATVDWVKQLQRNFQMPPQVREEEGEEEEFKDKKPKQLQAYVAWVNSQLKKKPGMRAVDDLSQMKDGVALSHLIEIVANERLEGVSLSPTTTEEMVSNVEKVLHFMTSRRIRMHLTTAPDIVKGKPKTIMRLILALAAHYKPQSVRHSSPQGAPSSGIVSPRSHPTLIGIAHGAAAALADARRDAAAIHPRPQRPRYLDNRFQEGGHNETDGGRADDAERADPLRGAGLGGGRPTRERGELEGASCGSSPRSSVSGSPKINRRLDFGVHSSQSQEFEAGYEREEEVAERCDSCEGGDVWNTLADDHSDLASELAVTKRALHQLQELLLSGQPPDGQEDPESRPCEGSTAEEQLVVLRSQLQHTEDSTRDLREELSKVKNEAMQLQGTKMGLQKRLADQEEAFLKMKAELLRVGFSQQSLHTEKADLERKVLEKDRTVLDLRRELAHRDRQIEELVASLQFQQQDKEMSTRALHAQIIDLHEKLQLVGDTEVSLSHRLANQDRKMAVLEGKLLHTQFDGPGSRPSSGRSTQSSNNEDIQVVRDSLQSLRSFVGNDPSHHTIDALEHSISSLMERLQMSEASRLSDSMNTTSGRPRVNYDSTGDARRSPISSLQMQGMHRLDSSSGSSGGSSTKVLYFTDRAVTPFMCTIPRRLGEITLRDFRGMFDRHGQYRFHFKAMDPEFGTVKEEITHDDDIIPGWEGKIVAWIEEDHA